MTIRYGAQVRFTLFFLAVFAVAIASGWEWPYIAALMPLYVAAIPGFLLTLVQVYREVSDWEGTREQESHGIEMDEVYTTKLDKETEMRRTLIFFAWFVGGAVAIWLLGIVIALPLLVFLYGLIDGKEKWTTALIMGGCTYALIWGLFEYMMEMRWPPGALWR
ncbi:MAG: tripartite tricarboxylate transporter TctB family protein [Candidatus Binatia bacterium]